jgi:sugar phosphate isomerase/epimerase
MKTMQGPGIFLAQFAGDSAPFNSLDAICGWAASLGYKGVQIPTWDSRLFDLAKAAQSDAYCDEVKGTAAKHGLAITELSTHLQGQLVAVHPAFDDAFDGFAAPEVRGNPKARQEWAVEQMRLAAQASRRLGLNAHVTFPGALAWPFVYPWPQRPAGLVETAFTELGSRWKPILDAFDEAGVDVCYEIHPGEDIHDGLSFERFLDAVGGHKPFPAAAARLHRLHRHLSRAHQGLSRQGRRVQPHRPRRRLWRLCQLDRPGRAVPLAGRRAGRFRRDILQARGL